MLHVQFIFFFYQNHVPDNNCYIEMIKSETNIKYNIYNFNNLISYIGAIAAYSIGKLELNWYKIGDLFFGFGSILIGLVLLGCFYVRIMWFIYVFYILYGCFYQTLLTIAE